MVSEKEKEENHKMEWKDLELFEVDKIEKKKR